MMSKPPALAFSRAPSQAVLPNSASAPMSATVRGLGDCAAAISNQPREKANVPSSPPGTIEKYRG